MKATSNIQSFSISKSILHIAEQGNAQLLQPPFNKAVLGALDGRILATFPISTAADAHSDSWEMHPDADEVLFMLTGALEIEHNDGVHIGTVLLEAGHGMVMPKGVWHRLELREPGLLLALTAPHGTEARSDKEMRS